MLNDGGSTRVPSQAAQSFPGSTQTLSGLESGLQEQWCEEEDNAEDEDCGNAGPSQPAAGEEEEEEVQLTNSLGLAEVQTQAERFLRSIGLRPQDAGARNRTRWRGRVLWNQCFYLSLARAYLGHEATPRRIRPWPSASGAQ
mmetsp:Transcript_15007/g.30543  ORF Transcript_15007/g.30543 Transcript_15007/m.30543 type:complete len:142 (-) Transcript_15007:371-796(-)